MTAESNAERHWTEPRLRAEELLGEDSLQLHARESWCPENETARLEELEAIIETTLENHHALIRSVERGCPTYKKTALSLVVQNISKACSEIKSYAKYLTLPESLFRFDWPELAGTKEEQSETRRRVKDSWTRGLLSDALLQLHPSVPWSDKNEIPRLENIETSLKTTLKCQRILIHTAEEGCLKYKKWDLVMVMRSIRYTCGRIASYARYLTPTAVIRFDNPE